MIMDGGDSILSCEEMVWAYFELRVMDFDSQFVGDAWNVK